MAVRAAELMIEPNHTFVFGSIRIDPHVLLRTSSEQSVELHLGDGSRWSLRAIPMETQSAHR